MELIPILLRMSLRGLLIDHEVRERLESKYEQEVEELKAMCEGFNPGSPPQVGFILGKRGNMLPLKRRRNKEGKWETKISTEAEALEKLDDPLAAVVLRYRTVSKALSTYIRPYEGKERAYTRWHLEAATGRPSSTRRNLQNMRIDLREMIIPDNGVFTNWDASQIELRCLAYISQDEEMLHIYETGGDIHQTTADFMRIDRKIAKNTNFAMIYGGSDETIMETAHILNRRRATELREMWFDLYRGAARWIQMIQEKGMEDGYVETLYGRKLALPIGRESPAEIARKAVNYPIQASASEIIKRAMIKCQNLPLVMQLHDELMADGDVSEEVVGMGLENIAPFRTPYEIRTSRRWE